jgi:hypothetical protein
MDCIKCGKPADKKYSPDLDVESIGMCNRHEEEIKINLLIAQFEENGWEKFEKKYLKSKKNGKI